MVETKEMHDITHELIQAASAPLAMVFKSSVSSTSKAQVGRGDEDHAWLQDEILNEENLPDTAWDEVGVR